MKIPLLLLAVLITFASNAQLIHKSFNPYIMKSCSFDFNNDGTTDISITRETFIMGPESFIEGSDNCFFTYNNDDVDTISEGDLISFDNLVYENTQTSFVQFLKNEPERTTIENIFVGYKINVGNDSYFGWLRFRSDGWNFWIKDYCYNSIPNEGIYAGDSIPQIIENNRLKDIANYFDGRDLQITLEKPYNENNIIEIRGFIIKDSDSESFSVDSAKINENYFGSYTVQNIPDNIRLDSNSFDSDGELISNLNYYRSAFLSIVVNGVDTIYYLSGISNSVIFSNPLESVSSIQLLDTNNSGNSSDIELTFSPWENNKGIGEYRLFFSDRSINDTLNINQLLDSDEYISIGITDTLNYNLPPFLTDFNGNKIEEGTQYDVYILSIADSLTHVRAAYKIMEGVFELSTPNHFYSGCLNYPGFQYFDIPDTNLWVSGAHESIYELDINNDNIVDFIFKQISEYGAGFSYDLVTLSPENNEILEFEHVAVEKKFQYNSSLSWTIEEQILELSHWEMGAVQPPNMSANINDLRRYIPFRVYANNDTLTGYLEMIESNYANHFILLGYGYYSSINTSTQDIRMDEIEVYPNPVTEILNIKVPNNDFIVSIYNMEGRIFFSESYNSETSIAVNDFIKGLYILKIVTKNKAKAFKIIIE